MFILCFMDIEERVAETIEKYGLMKKSDKVVVALSGGKDSRVAPEARLACQNCFAILDKKSVGSKFRNFQFIIPQKIMAASPPRFLVEVLYDGI